jgi:hypothetical protein
MAENRLAKVPALILTSDLDRGIENRLLFLRFQGVLKKRDLRKAPEGTRESRVYSEGATYKDINKPGYQRQQQAAAEARRRADEAEAARVKKVQGDFDQALQSENAQEAQRQFDAIVRRGEGFAVQVSSAIRNGRAAPPPPPEIQDMVDKTRVIRVTPAPPGAKPGMILQAGAAPDKHPDSGGGVPGDYPISDSPLNEDTAIPFPEMVELGKTYGIDITSRGSYDFSMLGLDKIGQIFTIRRFLRYARREAFGDMRRMVQGANAFELQTIERLVNLLIKLEGLQISAKSALSYYNKWKRR